MSVKSKNIKSNLKQVDAHIIRDEEYDELPELTDEMFERAVYKVGGIKKPVPRRGNTLIATSTSPTPPTPTQT